MITDFFLKYNGKKLDYDGVYDAQCVDPIKAYFVEVLGLKPVSGDAIDYWRDIPDFDRIPKGLFNKPQPGDIVIFDRTSANPYGHIAICNYSRFFDFGVFEQNYPLGKPCQFRDVPGYTNVLGWLRPKTKKIEVAFIGMNIPSDLSKLLREFGGLVLDPKIYPGSIKDFDTDEAMARIDQVNPAEKYVIIGCDVFSGYDKASYHPGKNKAFAVCYKNCNVEDILHELLHCFRKYRNFNHQKPYIEDAERYPTDWEHSGPYNSGWAFPEQYKQLFPYL